MIDLIKQRFYRLSNSVETAVSKELFSEIILFSFFVFLAYWYRWYFSPQYISGWDLPSQITTVNRMMSQLPNFRFVFYDPAWFGGWAVDLFYAPLSHITAALLAYLLTAFTDNPARLSCHLILGAGCSALPFSIWYFLNPMAQKIVCRQTLSKNQGCLLASSICLFSFWFLNHDYQFWGIGSASVMGIGLFAQLFGWHFLLLQLGAVSRLLETGKVKFEKQISILFALLVLSHSLTSLFALGFVFLLALWYQKFARQLLRAHCLGLALAGFWLIPACLLSLTYAVYSMIKPSGDFLEIFFRYPLALLVKHFQASLAGQYAPIDFATLLSDVLFFIYVPCQPIRRSQTAIAFFIVNVIAIVFTNSGFLANCLQMTVHYYRFSGDELLILVALLSLVPLGISQCLKPNVTRPLLEACIYLVLASGIYSISSFPHYERAKTEKFLGKPPEAQVQVLQYFKSLPLKGRILMEHFDDESRHGFLAAHYLEARLYEETGFETINGLFIEGTNSYRLAATSADMLGAHTWSTNLIFGDSYRNTMSIEPGLSELREFGITHIVCTDGSKLFQHLKDKSLTPVVFYGPFAIIQIAELPAWKIKSQDKTLVGFIDAAHNMPFQLLEAYVLTHKSLYESLEVIDLTGRDVPPGIPLVIVNSGADKGPIKFPRMLDTDIETSQVRLVRLNFDPHWTIDHYHVWYQDNAEYDNYHELAVYLDEFKLSQLLRQTLPAIDSGIAPDKNPTLQWSRDFQSMKLKNLRPGRFVKIAYGYLPFWHSTSGLIFRGSAEQIYVYPTASNDELLFDEWHTPYLWLGSLVTAIALFFILKCRVPFSERITGAIQRVKTRS